MVSSGINDQLEHQGISCTDRIYTRHVNWYTVLETISEAGTCKYRDNAPLLMMAPTLVLIRHAQALHNVDNKSLQDTFPFPTLD